MTAQPALHLTLDAEPQSVGQARRAFQELADDLGMKEPRVGDLLTLVSEASGNVVRHAYPEGSGTFEIDAFISTGIVTVVVRDFGAGIRPALESDPSTMKLGLGLISVLSSHFEIQGDADGTELRMQMRLV